MANSSAGDGASSDKPLTLGDLLTLCWRRRYAAGTMGILVAISVLVYTMRITPLYQADASLAVDRGRRAMDPQVDIETGRVEYGFLNTERDRLLASPVLEKTLEDTELGTMEPYTSAEDPVATLRDRITVTTSRDSYVIDVSLRDERGDMAQRALHRLIDNYLARKNIRRVERASGVLEWLNREIADTRTRLQRARDAERSFRDLHSILSIDPEGNRHAVRLTELDMKRVALEQELAGSHAVIQQIQAAMVAAEQSEQDIALLRIERINRHPVVVEQQQLLYELRDRFVLVKQKFLSEHPRAIEIREQIQAKEQHLHEAIQMARSALESTYHELQLQIIEIDTAIAAESGLLNTYRDHLIGLQARLQEVDTQQDMLDRLLKKQTEEQVASTLEAGAIEVIHPPKVGVHPVNIKRPLFAAAALLLGTVAAVAFALILEVMDRRVRSAEVAQEISGLAPFGMVPFSQDLAKVAGSGSYNNYLFLSEAFRHMRASLFLSQKQQAGRCLVLAFTSASSGDGKSTVALGFARAVASTGKRVLLVDGDLRKPTLHRRLDLEVERGFSFLLVGEADVEPLHEVEQNMDFLGVGVMPPNPAELLHGPAFTKALERWRQDYDMVVFDTPPVALVSDALLVGDQADRVLLVVRDHKTHKTALRQAMNGLNVLGDKLIGFVFNAERADQRHYGYGHYINLQDETLGSDDDK
jgi:polysaccharide biosynthesis transport protein